MNNAWQRYTKIRIEGLSGLPLARQVPWDGKVDERLRITREGRRHHKTTSFRNMFESNFINLLMSLNVSQYLISPHSYRCERLSGPFWMLEWFHFGIHMWHGWGTQWYPVSGLISVAWTAWITWTGHRSQVSQVPRQVQTAGKKIGAGKSGSDRHWLNKTLNIIEHHQVCSSMFK